MNDLLPPVYHDGIPDFLRRAADAPAMRRLADVGMSCGCEYTSFPRFAALAPCSRLTHSLGVGLIAWHFTGDAKQALAGLFHDIATPCFAHVVDFLNGDHLTQESTEDGTAARIAASPELLRVLESRGLTVAQVCDYHAYPIADNDTPRLSADRLEYTLSNAVNYGFARLEDARAMYGDLCVGTAEDGAPELAFRSAPIARRFCDIALQCSEVYVSDADRCAMQYLAELLGEAIAAGVLARDDLWRTEPEVIALLTADPSFSEKWRRFRALNATERGAAGRVPAEADGWRVIPAKKRWIDPLVGGVRATRLFPDYAGAARAFLARSQSIPVRALVQTHRSASPKSLESFTQQSGTE